MTPRATNKRQQCANQRIPFNPITETPKDNALTKMVKSRIFTQHQIPTEVVWRYCQVRLCKSEITSDERGGAVAFLPQRPYFPDARSEKHKKINLYLCR